MYSVGEKEKLCENCDTVLQSWSPSHSLKSLKKKLLDSTTDDKSTAQRLSGEGDIPAVGSFSTNADPSAGK